MAAALLTSTVAPPVDCFQEGEPHEHHDQRSVGELARVGWRVFGAGRSARHVLSWAPSYVVDISEPTTARITAKAEIVNEIEDLSNAAVKFITG